MPRLGLPPHDQRDLLLITVGHRALPLIFLIFLIFLIEARVSAPPLRLFDRHRIAHLFFLRHCSHRRRLLCCCPVFIKAKILSGAQCNA